MLANADLIPGIYNYCDSWCERCRLTHRCRSYLVQAEAGLNEATNANASLVDQLTEALNLTKRYLENLKNTHSSLADMPADEALSEQEKAELEAEVFAPARRAEAHPATRLAETYLKQTGTWLADEKGLLERAGQQQLHEVNLGLRTEEEAMTRLTALKDAYEQIRWYRTLIPVKAMSALRALDEPTDDDFLLDYYNGKAKLVLVSIDRSVAAWQTIMQEYPDKTDDLLDMLANLSQLSRHLDTLFPDARPFRRPGLD
jgi:hypothetical protein